MISKKRGSVKLENTLIIVQEISLVKTLCSNEQSVRHRGLCKLSRWLKSRSQGSVELDENDFSRLWKGLFYCLWMADKPLYQEEVAELISLMVHCFSSCEDAVKFIKAFFKILGQEWPGIDHLRMDKCMMLVRRVVRQSFFILSKNGWNQEFVGKLASCYRASLDFIPVGLIYHFSEIYVNELSKVGGKKLDSGLVLNLVRPFAEYISTLTNGPLISYIASSVFLNLIRYSEAGVEHESRFKAWRDRGFPEGRIDVIKKVNSDDGDDSSIDGDDDNDDGDKVLDPRAGRIDVELPVLKYDPIQFVDMFQSLRMDKFTTTKARRQMGVLIEKFSSMSAGKYPLGLQRFELPDKRNWKNVIRRTAKELIESEKNCLKDGQNSCLNLSRHEGLDSGTQSGVWQVTPIKGSCRNKQQLSSTVLVSSGGSSKWIVVDQKKDTNEISNNNNNNSNKFENDTLNKKRLKRKRGTNEDWSCAAIENSDSGNGFSDQEKKIVNVSDKANDIINGCIGVNDSDESSEVEELIKRPKSRFKTKKNPVQLISATYNMHTKGNSVSVNGKASHVKMLKNESILPTTPSGITSDTADTSTNISFNAGSSGKRKRVAFLLNKNTVQEEKEYLRLIKEQPVVQFDGEKQPAQPIYKDKGVKSPINPFYKRLGFTSL